MGKNARRFCEKAGFFEKGVEEGAFSYQNERWSRCGMEIRKE